MRKFSQLSIIVSHEGNEDSVFSAPVVEVTNGNNSVQVSDFESALGMLPPGSDVCVIAKGTVGNRGVHNLSRIIREGCVRVSLDLSAVTEAARVFDSPFQGNQNLVSMKFPQNLLALNPVAFADCKNLESVNIPATVQKIGAQAFSGCENLSFLEFADPNGWESVDSLGSCEPVSYLEKSEDNPFRFTLPSSPLRNCVLQKANPKNQ